MKAKSKKQKAIWRKTKEQNIYRHRKGKGNGNAMDANKTTNRTFLK